MIREGVVCYCGAEGIPDMGHHGQGLQRQSPPTGESDDDVETCTKAWERSKHNQLPWQRISFTSDNTDIDRFTQHSPHLFFGMLAYHRRSTSLSCSDNQGYAFPVLYRCMKVMSAKGGEIQSEKFLRKEILLHNLHNSRTKRHILTFFSSISVYIKWIYIASYNIWGFF